MDCTSSARSATSGATPRQQDRKGHEPCSARGRHRQPRPGTPAGQAATGPGPRGWVEPASVSYPSAAAHGRWPVTLILRSRVDNHLVPVRWRSLRDLPLQPIESPRICAGNWPAGLAGGLQACLQASRRHPGYSHSSSTSLCTAPYTPDPAGAGVIGACSHAGPGCRKVSRARLRSAVRAWIIPGAAAGLDWEDPKNWPMLQVMTGWPWPARSRPRPAAGDVARGRLALFEPSLRALGA